VYRSGQVFGSPPVARRLEIDPRSGCRKAGSTEVCVDQVVTVEGTAPSWTPRACRLETYARPTISNERLFNTIPQGGRLGGRHDVGCFAGGDVHDADAPD
jgi:hypothetical protein